MSSFFVQVWVFFVLSFKSWSWDFALFKYKMQLLRSSIICPFQKSSNGPWQSNCLYVVSVSELFNVQIICKLIEIFVQLPHFEIWKFGGLSINRWICSECTLSIMFYHFWWNCHIVPSILAEYVPCYKSCPQEARSGPPNYSHPLKRIKQDNNWISHYGK